MGRISFSDEVRAALATATEAARIRDADNVGTEHILLGLVRESPEVFAHLGGAATLEEAVDRLIPRGRPAREVPSGALPYTSRAKRVLELALREARNDGDAEVLPEHLALGIIREKKGIGAAALAELGADSRRAWLDGYRGGIPGPQRLEIRVDDSSDRTFYEQIVDQVQEAIAAGSLAPGDRLPSVRHLADVLELAPGTVARAYRALEEAGVVETDGARGTRVTSRPRGASLTPTERVDTLVAMLRPIAVAAFHLGAELEDLRTALRRATAGVFR